MVPMLCLPFISVDARGARTRTACMRPTYHHIRSTHLHQSGVWSLPPELLSQILTRAASGEQLSGKHSTYWVVREGKRRRPRHVGWTAISSTCKVSRVWCCGSLCQV